MSDELEIVWKLKQELEDIGKQISAGCDGVYDPYDVYRFGFKCMKKGAGVQVLRYTDPRGCKAYLLNADEKVLEELRKRDAWRVAPYDETRRAHREPFDIELPITCRREEFERVFKYLTEMSNTERK